MAIIETTKRDIRSYWHLLALVAVLIWITAYSTDARGRAPAARESSVQIGLASWYGRPHHGRQTASGEIYNMNQLTAAHRTLPFGTVVRVQNLRNNRTVKVKINDRGPWAPGRIIDLSRAAARTLRMEQAGLARVKLKVVQLPDRVQT